MKFKTSLMSADLNLYFTLKIKFHDFIQNHSSYKTIVLSTGHRSFETFFRMMHIERIARKNDLWLHSSGRVCPSVLWSAVPQ
jgi:hypothetical protein